MSRVLGEIFDVAVVGAGVFGAWTAYELRRSGKSVTLLDAHGPANSLASSGDESRIIRMGYGADEIYTRSALESLQRWQDFSAQAGETVFHQTGVLWLAHATDPYAEKTCATLQKIGIPLERLTTEEVQRRYPQIGLEGIAWAMLEPESGVLLARTAVQAIVREATRIGVQYFQDEALAPHGKGKLDRLLTARGRRVSSANYVFACGPWLPKIFPDLLKDRIHPTRQEVFYFASPADDPKYSAPQLPTWIDFKDEMYGLPGIEGRGVKIAIDRHGEAFDPDSGDRTVTEAGLAAVRRCLGRRLPALKDSPLKDARVCQYENTSNGDFLIDRHPDFENVWLAGGGSGHGFKHGPAVGEYLAARIDGSPEGIEPRFSLETKKSEQSRAVY